jgi:vitamin B12 transport system substrate-binding protein
MSRWLILLSLLVSEYTLGAPIHRIITLSPHTTEIAFAAGLGNKVIAVSEHSDYPPQVASLEKVASYQGINIEKILALKPDLVIAWPEGNPRQALQKLKSMGVQVYLSRIRQLKDIADDIEALSQYADQPQIGHQHAQAFRQTLSTLKKRYIHARKVRFFYQLSQKPIITIAQDSWPSEVFRLCGGVNIFENAPAPYPQVSIGQVLVAKPEVIFSPRQSNEKYTRQTHSWSRIWFKWSEIPAVRQGYLWSLNSDWLNRPTPRTLDAVKEICHDLDIVRQHR